MRPELKPIYDNLLKSINKRYFTEYEIEWREKQLNVSHIFPVTINTTVCELKDISYCLHDGEFKCEVEDVISILKKSNKELTSFLSIDIIDAQRDASEVIKDYFKYQNGSNVVREIVDILELHSNEVYIVGGCIRDILRRQSPKDIDFVTDTDIDILVSEFKSNGYKTLQKGEQFLVLIVEKNGEQFEISRFRKDKDNNGGIPGTIFDDAVRRDFTCNSVYFRTTDHQIVDITGGLFDIFNGILRFIGKGADRIKEDPNRVFRAYRFIGKGFTPDNKTLKCIRQYFDYSVQNTSPERIRCEIEKMVSIK